MTRIRPARLSLLVLAALACAACDGGDSETGGKPPVAPALTIETTRELLALQARGIGLLERFEYVAATEPLRKAVELAPDWVPGRVHLGLALMNAQTDRPDEAYEILLAVVAEDPGNARAAFLAGRLAENSGDEKKAYELYKSAYDTSGDAVAGAKLGTLLANLEREGAVEEALEVLERVHADRPSLVSPVNGLMLLYARQGDDARSDAMRLKLLALKGRTNPEIDQSKVGQDITDAYGNMGPLSMCDRSFGAPMDTTSPAPTDVTFAAPRALSEWKAGAVPPGVVPFLGAAVLDYDADGDLDLFLCGGDAPCALLRNDGKLSFKDVAKEAGLALTGVYAAAAGEVDIGSTPRAGKEAAQLKPQVDLVLVLEDGVRLLLNDGEGGFRDATDASGLGADPGGARGVLLVDADQEGDLDLFLSAGPGQKNRLWANKGPGVFEDVSESCGLAGDGGAYGPAVVVDVDHDLDLDLIVTRPSGSPALFLNDRLLRFTERSDWTPAGVEAPFGAVVGDFDRDGFEDVVLAGEASATWLRGDGREYAPSAIPGAPGGPMIHLDTTLYGVRDLVFATGTRVPGTGAGFAEPGTEAHFVVPGANIFAADLDGEGAEELVLFAPGAVPQLVTVSAEGAGNALVLDFQGVIRDDQQAGWSNLEGRGAAVEVRAGPTWQYARVGGTGGFGVSVPTRQVFGVGPEPDADFVRLLWPDGVQHGVLDVPVGAPFRVIEEQLRPDSCPLIFAWNGERFVFIADFLGAGGVGFLLAPEVYGEPDPTETVRLPEGTLVPDARGRLDVRLPEAMEETCYLDLAELVVLDHPAALRVHPNERFAGEPPFPNGGFFAHEREILPATARNARNEDVLERLATIDRRYHEDHMTLHPRLLGATGENILELDFGNRLADVAPGDGLVFHGNGWIEYGYTRTSVAAAGEGFEYVLPTLEAWVPGADEGGTWKTLVANFGFPAGFPRTMTYDVTGLVSRDTPRLRIRTNFEVYWDRVWLAPKAPMETVREHVLPAGTAELRWIGYPREFSPDGRHPRIYDYGTLDRDMPWKTVEGEYTRYGDVRPLLSAADDEYVIYGKGEEIAVQFDGSSLPALADGWTRTYFLRFSGWCKGQELYTAHGFTVEPLPFLGMSNYPYRADESYPETDRHRRYRREWNTRSIRRKPRR